MEIYKKMAQILKEIDPIKKEKTNTQGAGFKYRGIDDVMNALHESFAKNEVFLLTEIIDRKEVERQSKSGGVLFYVTSRIRFTFCTSDGSSVSSIVDGTAMDSGDKADNKCMSIALKYALLQAFLIPTEEMKDPDATSHEVQPIKTQTQTEPKSKAKVSAENFKSLEAIFNGTLPINIKGKEYQSKLDYFNVIDAQLDFTVEQKQVLIDIINKQTV